MVLQMESVNSKGNPDNLEDTASWVSAWLRKYTVMLECVGWKVHCCDTPDV